MDDTTIIIVGAGALAFLLLGNIAVASAAESSGISVSGKGFIDKTLTEISGANWTTPLFLTLERNVALGAYGLDTLFNITSTVGSGIYSGVSTVGNAIGNVLSTTNQIVSGTVIPAVISAGGTIASYVSTGAGTVWSGLGTGASYVGSGLNWVGGYVVDLGKTVGGTVYTEIKALPGQIVYVGKGVWDYTKIAGSYIWDKVSGTFKYIGNKLAKSDLLKNTGKAIVGIGASAVISHNMPNSDITNDQQGASGGDITGTNTPQIIPLGYLSKTPFDTPKSMIVKKMFNATVNDTRIVTDQETYEASIEIGYKEMGILGYCSPEPFLGAANMISMFNPNTIDSVIITNYDVIPQMEKLGYQSLGTVGYCKALV